MDENAADIAAANAALEEYRRKGGKTLAAMKRELGIDCRHLKKADEAYSIDVLTGKEEPAVVHMCIWSFNHADDLLADAPRWVNRHIGGGLAIDPERDCTNCPAYSALSETAS